MAIQQERAGIDFTIRSQWVTILKGYEQIWFSTRDTVVAQEFFCQHNANACPIAALTWSKKEEKNFSNDSVIYIYNILYIMTIKKLLPLHTWQLKVLWILLNNPLTSNIYQQSENQR